MLPESAPPTVRALTSLPRRHPAPTDPQLFGRTPFASPVPILASAPSSTNPNPDDFLRALGRRIRLLRLTRELTQAQLADAAGMSRSFVSLVEHGGHGIDVVRLLRLATVFGLPLTDLIDVNQSR